MTTRMADLPTSRRHCLSDDDIEPAVEARRPVNRSASAFALPARPAPKPPVIERGVPVPKGNFGRWSNIAVRMQVGDSVVVALEREANGLTTAIRRLGAQAKQRRESDGRYRVWRTT